MNATHWHTMARQTNLEINDVIDGKTVGCAGEGVITKQAPHNGQQLYQFKEGEPAAVDKAVTSARQAFEDGRWQHQPIHHRKAVLQKLAELIEENRETLALYECLDVGKPITFALNDDIPSAAASLRSCAEGLDKLFSMSGADGATMGYQRRKPVGVVGAIIGWNYPLSLAAAKVGPALAMGNSLVLKPSELSSLSAGYLAALALEAGVPPGVFNVVNGRGHIVGSRLAAHPGVDLLSFVGSTATGKQMMIAAGESNMKRLILECGGKSPYLVFDDCPKDLDYLAANIVATAFPNQGAVCVAGTRLLVHSSIKDKLLPKILEHTTKIVPMDPLDEESRFGALISEEHMNKVLSYIDSGRQEGATCLIGGERVNTDTGGYYVTPTIFDNVAPQQRIAQEEIFGPVLSVLTFNDEKEAIALANSTCFGLSAYAATENIGRAQRLGQQLSAGSVLINSTSTPSGGFPELGVEGHRQSGFGYETGLAGLAAYTVTTGVYIMT